MISLKTDLGVILKEPESQTELLNEFYDTVFRTDNGKPIPVPSVIMDIPLFTPCLVHEKLSKEPQRVQAQTNCILICLSGWPPSSQSLWQIYLTTPLRQLSCRVNGRWH